MNYGAAAERADDMIIRQVCNEVEGELKEWLNTLVPVSKAHRE